MTGAPHLFTIAPGVSFVDALAAGVLAQFGDNPLTLGRVVILLPTRRGVRALREAFLRARDGRALLLPDLRALGDVDEEELSLSGAGALDLAPEIPPLRRQFLLARLVMRWNDDYADQPAQAAALAGELGRFLDQVQTEQLDFRKLADLVPREHAEHWKITLDFLDILGRYWPEILAEEGCLDASERRNRLLAAQAEQWRASPPIHPVIAAGSTGSVPASADLLAVIAGLARGAVVLPGFDRDMGEESWAALEPGHPQFTMKQLLERLGVHRHEVRLWPVPETASLAAADPARADMIREAMRPPATTHYWAAYAGPPPGALAGLSLIEAPGPREEAGVITLMMRRTLETPGETAALVTADRGLARRVAAALERWNVAVDDSAGTPLGEAPAAVFLKLIGEMIASDCAPVALLAALKHPLAAFGAAPGAFRARVRGLEKAVLRGPRPAPGFDGLLAEEMPGEMADWLGALKTACQPLTILMARENASLDTLARAHLALAEQLARSADEDGAARLWAGEDGAVLADFFAELLDAAPLMAPVAPGDYPALLGVLMAGRVMRPRYGRHPRLFIWGPLEARLQQADLLILGGLNEGSWPPETPGDPWMSRPMKAAFGLPSPERRIGLSAHDFAQAVCAPRVALTRALKVEGAPGVPSRWLLRLDNLIDDGLPRDRRWLDWLEELDRPPAYRPLAPPEPRPPLTLRPRRLSVTAVETWMRDPYALYARHILGLRPLEALDADPGAAQRGTFIHEILDRFVREHPRELPDDSYERLLEIGRQVFGASLTRPAVWAFWWPRFCAVARWFLTTEADRRQSITPLATEVAGRIEIAAGGAPFTLTAKADRIDRRADGRLEIIDYKTGQPPSARQLHAGYAPQLPLESVIAREGGFEGIAPAVVAELAFWRLSGGDPPGKIRLVGEAVERLTDEARAGLIALIEAFDDERTPYRAHPRPEVTGWGDYDHLARVLEWADGVEDTR